VKKRQVKCVERCNKDAAHDRIHDTSSVAAQQTPQMCENTCAQRAAIEMADAQQKDKLERAKEDAERRAKHQKNMELEEKDEKDFQFLETEVTVSRSEAEYDVEGVRRASEALKGKVDLLEALEQEAFNAGMEVRKQAEEAVSLAETTAHHKTKKDVPTTVYEEEGHDSWMRSGYNKFSQVHDPFEEMDTYGRPKHHIRGLRRRVAERYANITAQTERFQYDGADTDAPVQMFIAYAPEVNVTRQLTVATLSSLRHSLFMAPLRVKYTVPELVPVPHRKPEDATTV